MKKKKRLLLGISFLAVVLIILFFLKTVCFPSLRQRLRGRGDFSEGRNDLSGIQAAVYFGAGMDSHSALALGRALQWMGCQVEVVDASAIREGSLAEYEMIACPGGRSLTNPWEELGLDLFPGIAYCGQEEIAPQGGWPLMTWLRISGHTHPVTESLPERVKIVCYPNGPYLEPYSGMDKAIIATYEITGNPAMVVFEFGEERVFLSGPHPEIEVDSDRDGSRRFHKLSDEGSEWPLLLEVVKWLTAR